MKITSSQTDENTLSSFGVEAVEFVTSRNFTALAERFGYALANDRDAALAIAEDFEQCLIEAENPSSQKSTTIEVKYFKGNDASLYALVECVLQVSEVASVLVELIVTGMGKEKHITLEQISYVA